MPEFTTLGPGPNGQDRRGGVGAVRTSENTCSTTFVNKGKKKRKAGA
jgi:hypothetical protein